MITVEEARQYYPQADSAHGFDHVLRVLVLAERIARAEGADLEIVRAAVLLHDVGRAEEAQGNGCHACIGAARAREILQSYPQDRVEAVVEVEESPLRPLEEDVFAQVEGSVDDF